MRRIGINAEGTAFDYMGEAIDVPGVTEVYTQFVLFDLPAVSTVLLREDLRSGSHDPGFLEPPEPTTPAFGVAHPLHDPIVWTSRDDDALFLITVTRGTGDAARAIWTMLVPGTAREAALPELPSTANAAALFTDALDGRIAACDYSGEEERCLRRAYDRSFELTP